MRTGNFVITDRLGRQCRISLKKNGAGIRIFLDVGGERYFVSAVEINNDARTAEIEELILVKGFRDFSRRGIGSEIVRILEKHLHGLGVKAITGVIIKSDVDSAEFWRKQGFAVQPFDPQSDDIIYQIRKQI